MNSKSKMLPVWEKKTRPPVLYTEASFFLSAIEQQEGD
jgi:hypothetical protein